MISAIVQSNKTRKHFVVTEILKFSPKTVGVFKLAMKRGSDNCRSSAIFDIIGELQSAGIKVIVYDPNYSNNTTLYYLDFQNSLEKFKAQCDLIIANRFAPELKDVMSKVLTRDLSANV